MPPALLLLAAGGSSRMGRSKQLLPYRGTTLLRHAVDAALGSGCHPVFVVIGCKAELMRTELAGLPLQIVENKTWANGMGTSIRAGLQALSLQPPPPAVVIMLCDQPGVTSRVLDTLIDEHQKTRAPIVASAYDNVLGVPALFDRSLFDELSLLDDSAGARDLIRRYPDARHVVSFPQGAVDIDRPDEYERLK